MHRTVVSCALGIAALLPAGCSDKDRQPDRPEPVPARGLVTYQRKPLAGANVSFQSLDGKVSAIGTTDAAGKVVLSTYDDGDGAPPGKYRVVVSVGTPKEIEPGVLAPEPEGGFKSPIPSKYANPDTTDLVVEITPDGPNEFIVSLK